MSEDSDVDGSVEGAVGLSKMGFDGPFQTVWIDHCFAPLVAAAINVSRSVILRFLGEPESSLQFRHRNLFNLR